MLIIHRRPIRFGDSWNWIIDISVRVYRLCLYVVFDEWLKTLLNLQATRIFNYLNWITRCTVLKCWTFRVTRAVPRHFYCRARTRLIANSIACGFRSGHTEAVAWMHLKWEAPRNSWNSLNQPVLVAPRLLGGFSAFINGTWIQRGSFKDSSLSVPLWRKVWIKRAKTVSKSQKAELPLQSFSSALFVHPISTIRISITHALNQTFRTALQKSAHRYAFDSLQKVRTVVRKLNKPIVPRIKFPK